MKKFSVNGREKSLLCAFILLAMLVVSLAFIAGTPLVMAQADEGTYALFDAVDMDNDADWLVGSEPGSYPFFDLKLMLTNVTDCYAASFSLSYDPTILNYSSIAWGDFADYTGKVVLPLSPSIDYENGYIIEGSIGQLGPTAQSVKNFTDPTWGWVATFTFEFIASPPAVGYPINTLINITDVSGRTSMWWRLPGQMPPERSFKTRIPCTFYYETVETLIHVVEGFDVVTVSNTVVSTPLLNVSQKELSFNVTAQGGMTGFCNVTIPKGLADGIIGVTVDSGPPDSVNLTENTTHTFVDFTYTLASTLQVTISAEWVIPEFQASTFLVMLTIFTIVAAILGKTFWSIKRRNRIIAK